ncbi:MAG: hypothetical protein L6R40_007449 [Gallowayella cf. fulva]|nr:MAG: hypothetical protein L6R40_007449 [Xanthomendoza cf. fulva]
MPATTITVSPYRDDDPLYVVYSGLPGEYSNILSIYQDQKAAVQHYERRLMQQHGHVYTPYETLQSAIQILKVSGEFDDPSINITIVRCFDISAQVRDALRSLSPPSNVSVMYNEDGLNFWWLCISEDEAEGFRQQLCPYYRNGIVIRSVPFVA